MHFSNQQRDFSSNGLSERGGIVAYFSMEIAITPDMPTYSGGLGVLAGDTMRSAADLGLGLCAVTLLHRKGYFQQHLDPHGIQSAEGARRIRVKLRHRRMSPTRQLCLRERTPPWVLFNVANGPNRLAATRRNDSTSGASPLASKRGRYMSSRAQANRVLQRDFRRCREKPAPWRDVSRLADG